MGKEDEPEKEEKLGPGKEGERLTGTLREERDKLVFLDIDDRSEADRFNNGVLTNFLGEVADEIDTVGLDRPKAFCVGKSSTSYTLNRKN